MGRGTAGERGVAEGLWEGNWDRQGNGQHEGHLGVFNIFFFFYKNAALSWNPNISFFSGQSTHPHRPDAGPVS